MNVKIALFKSLVIGCTATLTFILLNAVFMTGLSASVLVTSVVIGLISGTAAFCLKLLRHQQG